MPIHGTIKGAAETGKRKAIRLTATAFIGTVVAMFIAFSVIHMSKVNSKMESWDANYKQIEEEMQAFKDVSDAKTIRLYIKELNAMLDDIKFLDKIITRGQIADESLNIFFSEYSDKLNETNDMIFGHHTELTELEHNFKQRVIRLAEATDNNLILIDSLRKDHITNIKDIDVRMTTIVKDVDSITVKLDRAKETFVGKHVFK